VYRIGLMGGIGGGKTEAARVLRELGAVVIDADAIAREIVRRGSPALEAVVRTFGRGVLAEDGSLDRRALGAIVFGDGARLAELNAIVHPPLVDEILRRMEAAERERDAGVLVVDAALLADWDLLDAFDLVIDVRAPEDVRASRLEAAGLTREEALRRIAAQAPDERLARLSDVVIVNEGSLSQLRDRVAGVWAGLPRQHTEVTE
jgi:dephospho-CoA kinase